MALIVEPRNDVLWPKLLVWHPDMHEQSGTYVSHCLKDFRRIVTSGPGIIHVVIIDPTFRALFDSNGLAI